MATNTAITLGFPFEFGGQKYTKISLRRPKVRDLIAVDELQGSNAKKECIMFASLAQVPEEVISELDAKDYRQLQETYQAFLD